MEPGLTKNERQLAKYEAWILEMERREAELAKGRGAYTRFFYVLPLLSLLGFLRNVGTGAAALFTAILMWAFGMYTVRVRASDYRTNLEQSRKMAAELRKACADEKAREAIRG